MTPSEAWEDLKMIAVMILQAERQGADTSYLRDRYAELEVIVSEHPIWKHYVS